MNRRLNSWSAFMVLMLATGTVAAAKWVKWDTSRDEMDRVHAIKYFDADSVRRTGDIVRISFLIDFRKPQTGGNSRGPKSKSWVWEKEYDCRKRLHRYVRVAHHDGQMARGAARFDKAADSEFPKMSKWSTVESYDDSDLPPFKLACSRR